MNYINSVTVAGELPRDCEVKSFKTKDGREFTVARFSVRTEGAGAKGKTYSDYHTCEASGKTLDAVKGLKKGDFVEVQGRLKTETYINKDGVEAKATKIIVAEATGAASQKPTKSYPIKTVAAPVKGPVSSDEYETF